MDVIQKFNKPSLTHTEWELFDFGGGRITIPTPPNNPNQSETLDHAVNHRHVYTPNAPNCLDFVGILKYIGQT